MTQTSKRTGNYPYSDIRGKKFERLTALYPLSARCKKRYVMWRCRCNCGNEVDVSYNDLTSSNRKSCGCKKKEHDEALRGFLTHVDGTSLDILKSKKIPTNNTTGYKGVYLINGKYEAKIVFQKKQYHLGKYERPEEAARVRQEAEETLFGEVVAHYERWKCMADADPSWAARNPIHVEVQKDTDHSLHVTCYPVL